MHTDRKEQAKAIRYAAADVAYTRPHPRHKANGDEQRFRYLKYVSEEDIRKVKLADKKKTEKKKAELCEIYKKYGKPSYMMSFTKGLPHDYKTGLLENPDHFQLFVKGIDSGDPRDFRDTPLGTANNCMGHSETPEWKSDKAKKAEVVCGELNVRAWESAGAGLTFDLEGPDAQSVTMPPAPALGSAELSAEMAEVYVQALLRDVPFSAFAARCAKDTLPKEVLPSEEEANRVNELLEKLNCLPWFKGTELELSPEEQSRRRTNLQPRTAFRGIARGDDIGPYISQFLLAGNEGIPHKTANPNVETQERKTVEGFINYGAQSIDQKVRAAIPEIDYLTRWDEWYDVQNGADFRGYGDYITSPKGNKRRFITTPRDMATFVHFDALYQAYLNATLILLGHKVPLDPGIPFQEPDNIDHQQGFALFSGPHILTLVTEVATRALKAVRFQKFNVHRRLRPEALAARMYKRKGILAALGQCTNEFEQTFSYLKNCKILDTVAEFNKGKDPENPNNNYLLPMAYCEGSPMHPSYGAGHATVAGACVTMVKAFFDHNHPLDLAKKGDPSVAFVPSRDGKVLRPVDVCDSNGGKACLTVEGELNKLAANISIGRNWAGVHYFTDYIESIRMGEQVALGILEEQKLTYGENFSMTVPLFDGGTHRI